MKTPLATEMFVMHTPGTLRLLPSRFLRRGAALFWLASLPWVVPSFAQEESKGTTLTFNPAVESHREVEVFVPSTYEEGNAMPLVLLLHGAWTDPDYVDASFKFLPLTEREGLGFLLAHPDGTTDAESDYQWNHNGNREADDSAYLRSVIEGIQERLHVDGNRIWIAGHSNGGFMAYRMACEHADIVSAIVVWGGADTSSRQKRCQPSEPVHVLHIHGAADPAINYQWGALGSVAYWADYNGHREIPRTEIDTNDERTMDLGSGISGLDTGTTRWSGGSPDGIVELWTIHGGGHNPVVVNREYNTTELALRAMDWLFLHAKNRPPTTPELTVESGAVLLSFPAEDGVEELQSRGPEEGDSFKREDQPGVVVDGVRSVGFAKEEAEGRQFRLTGANASELKVNRRAVVLSYSESFDSWVVESHSTLDPGEAVPWHPIETVIVGDERRAFVPASEPQKFFRLRNTLTN